MASLPELLKEAFEKRDWSLVSEAHFMLTNTRLDSVAAAIHSPKSKIVLPEEPRYQMPTSPDGNKKYARTEQIDLSKSKYNVFVDDGTEAVEDKAIDKKLCQARPVPRDNRGTDMVNVICRNCNRTKTVSQALLNSKRFLCDECINKNR